jgi:hypothetical protein
MEDLTPIYVHLNPKEFSFSEELHHSHFVFNKLPDYAIYSVKQTEYFLETTPHIVDNQIVNSYFKSDIEDFFQLCKKNFPSFYNDPFWLLTLLRLYVVFLYCKKENLQKILHLEYDNLIYSNLEELQQLQNSIYFTRLGPYCSSAGIMYCNSLPHFEVFINRLLQIIQKGESVVRRFTRYDQLSEMILIDLISMHKKDALDYLPILPEGYGSENFDKLKVLFDCASYGQYLGGTNNGNNKGWFGTHQYIGQQIANKTIEVYFENKLPYIVFNNRKISILNLHIHSKNLKEFISYE